MTFNVDQFLIELQQLDIYLWVEDGQLAFDAPEDAFTDAIRLRVLAHKQEIMQALLSSEVITDQPIDKAPRTDMLPLSFAQQRLWFLDQLEPNSAFYNLLEMIRLEGHLNVLALEQSFSYLIARHESLRTTFDTIECAASRGTVRDGEPIQIIHPPSAFTLSVIAVDNEEEAQKRGQVEAATPFNLGKGPLLRVQLLKIADDKHFLLLTMHHIISDGWSIGVLVEELTHAYMAYAEGNVPTLPELPIQYVDFTVWQRELLSGDILDAQLSFWREQLAGAPELLELPTDRPRPPVPSHRGANYEFQIDADLTAKLNQLAVRHEATLFMVLHSAFSVLLSRYSRQTDIVIGTPIANRNRAEIEGLIGFFVNTLVLRTELDDNPSFTVLLERVRENTLAAYEHQDLPFEQLVGELELERTLSYTPLFQVMLALQNAETGTFALPSLTATQHLPELPFAKFDLTLFLTASEAGLEGMLEYSTDLFDEATIARMASHFEVLLNSIVSHPEAPVTELPLLTEPEYHQIVHEWNDTAVDFGEPQTIHALFEQQVERTPDAVALVFNHEQLTYHEVNVRANQLAHYLRQAGVITETPVGVCLNRHFDLIISILAIIKAGGAYVPLDPTYPLHRLHFMINDAGLTLILTQSDLLMHLPLDAQFVDVKRLDLHNYPLGSPDVDITTENLLYIMYTSGSTGQPKGIEILHRNVQRLINANFAQLDATQTFLQLASPSFDASTLEIWGSLCNGAKLVLYPNQVIDLRLIGELIQTHQISILWLSAGLFHQMVDYNLEGLNGVRQLLAGGDVLSVAHIERLLKSGPKELTLINGYGPTENTTFTTTYRVADTGPQATSVPIGVPISNTQVYILDEALHLTPIGVPGELYTGGLGVARGYLNRPELTAERFIKHPQFGRLYKTGDLCRWLPDTQGAGSGNACPDAGSIEFIGRTDFQVKIRGFRIELGEVESALLAQDGIREVVVLAREDNVVRGDKRLVAYFVGHADPDTIRQQLAQRLPNYMIPSAFVELEAMPLTPNGKLDRRALPAPDYALAQTAFVPPRNALEQQVADIWADVLGLDKVGIHDNFFDLGGHSLLATQVISRVRAQLNLEVPLKTLFSSSQLAPFARHISQTQESTSAVIQKVKRDGQLPLSFAQQRLWFLDQLEPDSAFYNIPTIVRLEGQLDVVALEQSFAYLISRHESLRTTFDTIDGEPIQVIHEPSLFKLPTITVSSEQQAMKLGEVEASTPFNLHEGPLLRVQLLKIANQMHFLLLNMHHIVSDGWSISVLVEELSHAYIAYAEGNDPTLPELPIQYADFAVWQRHYLTGDTVSGQLSFWREQLTGAPALLELPTDRPRPPVQSYRGAHYTFHLNADPSSVRTSLTDELNQLAQTHEATLFMVLHSAFSVLLSRYSRQTDLVIGTPIANRNRAEIEGLIGFFVNTLALRTQLDDNPTFTMLLNRVRQTTLAAYEHQDLPFEQLVDELELTRSLSYTPLFQVMLVLQNAEIGTFGLTGVRATLHPTEFPFAKFDLTLSLIPSDDGLMGVLEYSTDLFDYATIARMASHFAVLLNSIVSHPDKPVLQLPMLTDAEYHQIVHEWNDTAVRIQPQTIHALFEAQVQGTPDAIALVFNDEQLTYHELNVRANQLAHHLIELGVQAETLVAVAMERSLEMVVSLLAVLKAGGAYVPIDPSYPSERIGYMLTDSAAPILLTQSHLEFYHDTDYYTVNVIHVDKVGAQLTLRPTQNPQAQTSPEHLAYVIYTSGSTGQPKGVLIEHGAAFNVATAQSKLLPDLREGSRLLQLASLGFDAATAEIMMALTHGVTLVIAPAHHERLGMPLYELLSAQRISHLTIVPSILQTLPALDLPDLKVLITAGEACPNDLVNRWAGERAFFNFYGPTESPIWTTYAALQPFKGVHIGQPIPNRKVYILDERAAIVPVGVAGELYIGGEQLARAYLNRPELTAERFIQHSEFGRLYKTGDLCRWLPDGNIEFMGRTDFQVKIRGFRIELGEIENVLRATDGVREVVVLAREDNAVRGDKRLVAYLIGDADTNTLRRRLTQRLPDYMVPSAFVELEAMPLTPNGKVDRRALPAPDYTDLQAEFVAPRNDVEASLAHAFGEVLRLPYIGIHDNFFRVGGDSILSIQLVSRVAQQGYTVSVKELFQHPTIAQLATVIANVIRTGQEIHASQSVQIADAPLLPIQRWFLAANQPEMHHFNQSFLLTVKEPIDQRKLEAAIRALLRHHDALRFQYGRDESGWQQQYLAPVDHVPLKVVDLQEVAPEDRPSKIGAIGAQTQASLNPLVGDLTRWIYFKAGGDDRLLIVIHHLAVDGVSWRILLEDLTTWLSGGQLPPKTSSYRDWVETLQSVTEKGYFDADISHWLSNGDTPLPLDEPDALNTIGNSHHLSLTLSHTQTELLLRTLPDLHDVTLDAVLLTALTETLTDWSGHAALRVKFESYGRQELFDTINLNRTVGWFTSAYPLTIPRFDGTAVKRIRYTLDQLRRVTDGGISFGALHHFHPDEAIREEFDALPSAPVVYNYLGQLDSLDNERFGSAKESTGLQVSPYFMRDTLIDSNALVINGQLLINWTVSPQISRESAGTLLAIFRRQLNSLIAEARHSPKALPSDEKQTTSATNSWFVTLQNEGSRLPLFCFYPVTGTISQFKHLIPYLSPQQPVYALQARGIYDDLPSFKTLEALASDTIRAIKTIQPKGPYNLLGWSFGARLAYEIAQQLQAQGDQLALLGILDEYPDNVQESNAILQKAEYQLANFVYNLGLNREIDAQHLIELCQSTLSQHEEDSIRSVCTQLERSGYTFPFDTTMVERIYNVYLNNMMLIEAYQLKPYTGSVVVFTAEESDSATGIVRWQNLVSHSVKQVNVPGRHLTLLNPEYVETVGRELEKRLQQAVSS